MGKYYWVDMQNREPVFDSNIYPFDTKVEAKKALRAILKECKETDSDSDDAFLLDDSDPDYDLLDDPDFYKFLTYELVECCLNENGRYYEVGEGPDDEEDGE
jgi:hypothetical protein